MAAVLAGGEGAVLSHRAAAELWRLLTPRRAETDVTVPGHGGRRQRPGIRLHRSATLTQQETTRRNGVPVTSPARPLVDLRVCATPDELSRARRQAEFFGYRIEAADSKPIAVARNELERRFLRLCQRHHLPRPLVNAPMGGYEAYRARGVARDGRPFGCPPKPYSQPEAPDGKLNTTDPDARRMKFGRNFMPAYNAQAVTTAEQIIVAAEITTKGGDFEELEPMISAAERELNTAGVNTTSGVVLADAGYWSNDHIDSLRERGMIPIVAADTTRNRPRKNRLGGPYDFMRRVIASERGGDLYSRRQCMVEPVFAQIKSNR